MSWSRFRCFFTLEWVCFDVFEIAVTFNSFFIANIFSIFSLPILVKISSIDGFSILLTLILVIIPVFVLKPPFLIPKH